MFLEVSLGCRGYTLITAVVGINIWVLFWDVLFWDVLFWDVFLSCVPSRIP